MKLRNHTNIPSETIRALLRSVCPANVSNFEVEVCNRAGNGGRGVAYAKGTGFRGRSHPFIRVSIAKSEARARSVWRAGRRTGKGYLDIGPVGSRMEVLVLILAHELRHLWQSKVRHGWRVWGARGVFSERDADAYGLRMLRAFRRGELEVKPTAAQVVPERPKTPRGRRALTAEQKVQLQVVEKAAGLGATVSPGGVDAPNRKVWVETLGHTLYFCEDDGEVEMYQRVLREMEAGLFDCKDKDCDVCEDEEVAA